MRIRDIYMVDNFTSSHRRAPAHNPPSAASKGKGGWPKGKKRKVKPLRDHNAPRAPHTGYVRFLKEGREKVREDNPNMSFAEITKLLAGQWSKMSAVDKQRFLDEADRDKERYAKELQQYQQTEAFKAFSRKQEERKLRNELMEAEEAQTNGSAMELPGAPLPGPPEKHSAEPRLLLPLDNVISKDYLLDILQGLAERVGACLLLVRASLVPYFTSDVITLTTRLTGRSPISIILCDTGKNDIDRLKEYLRSNGIDDIYELPDHNIHHGPNIMPRMSSEKRLELLEVLHRCLVYNEDLATARLTEKLEVVSIR
eukprot:XP_011677993.1 PREDICTED: TOX high mobility group box family member 3 [Strongylocentrotus purpuratus]